MSTTLDPFNTPAPGQPNAKFLALLPKIRACAYLYFRHIPCPDTKADKVAETIALAWKWYCRLEEQGKDVALFPSVFVTLLLLCDFIPAGGSRPTGVGDGVAGTVWSWHTRHKSVPPPSDAVSHSPSAPLQPHWALANAATP